MAFGVGNSVVRSTVGTTGSIDTTGASLLVMIVSYYGGGGGNPTVSDSKTNTWTLGPSFTSASDAKIRIYYAENPVVGITHSFTTAGSSLFLAFSAIAFTGAALSGVFDAHNSNGLGFGAPPLATGSLTPAVNDSLLVAGISNDFAGNTFTIDSGFTVKEQSPYIGSTSLAHASGYLIQTTAAAVNPQWSWSGGNANAAAAIIAFKPASGAASPIVRPLRLNQAVTRAAYH